MEELEAMVEVEVEVVVMAATHMVLEVVVEM